MYCHRSGSRDLRRTPGIRHIENVVQARESAGFIQQSDALRATPMHIAVHPVVPDVEVGAGGGIGALGKGKIFFGFAWHSVPPFKFMVKKKRAAFSDHSLWNLFFCVLRQAFPLYAKHRFRQSDACRRFHGMLHKRLNRLPAVPAFGCIDDIIRFDQNLVVDAVDLRRAVVMPHQISHPINLCSRHALVSGQKLPHQRGHPPAS